MAAETATRFDALEAQARLLTGTFIAAGYEQVAPSILQPAAVFLDVIGEALRARTYVFNDPDGAELCLRPDLTVPTCRLHIERHGDAGVPARYCYNGPAFRFQPQGATTAHPREFRQAGIETFGDDHIEAADARTAATILHAIENAGYRPWSMRVGDLSLFRSILEALELPTRWQKRLGETFSQPAVFRAELSRIATAPGRRAQHIPPALARDIRLDDSAQSEAAVTAYLDREGLTLVGTRTVSEIAEHIIDLIKDADARPLDPDALALIEAYLKTAGPAKSVGALLAQRLKGIRGGPGAALDRFDRRLAHLANEGVDLDRVTFAADFDRPLGYYTGFVFDIVGTDIDAASPLAGGGRYDDLMRMVGTERDVPAVGGAIHTERLLAAVQGAVT